MPQPLPLDSLYNGPIFWKRPVAPDAHSEAIEEVNTFREAPIGAKLKALVFPLHVGTLAAASANPVCRAGTSAGLLAITGFLRWWRRSRPHRFQSANP